MRGVREYCPDVKTLANMKTMSIWAEGVEGRVHLEVRSMTDRSKSLIKNDLLYLNISFEEKCLIKQ